MGLNWFGVVFNGWELLVLLRYLGERGCLSGLRIILLWGGILLMGIIRIGLVICEGLDIDMRVLVRLKNIMERGRIQDSYRVRFT